MYFQLEVYYCFNEANKNKYKSVELIVSTKNILKIAKDRTGHCTRNDNLSYFVAWTSKYFVAWACCCLKVMFVSARYKSLYIYLNTIYVNKNQHSRSQRLFPNLSFIIRKSGVSLLHGLSLRINKIYIKIDKYKIKPYLYKNHSIGYISLFVDCFYYKGSLILVKVTSCILICFV